MKLITFTVPCYNSAAYMDHCIETLLTAGEDAEIILVDDGSKDDTGKIADAYAEKYPTIVRVIHQENGGHGAGGFVHGIFPLCFLYTLILSLFYHKIRRAQYFL